MALEIVSATRPSGFQLSRPVELTCFALCMANAVYLARKGTVPKSHVAKLAVKNIVINALRSFRPEPFVDRRGRLRGNLLALADLVRIGEPERLGRHLEVVGPVEQRRGALEEFVVGLQGEANRDHLIAQK